ncbi:PEP/pyruvate-binding domain-containing protein [Aquisalimonas asiatica]|uniref:Pyruvate, water dikinase n=1 Tax=Aquisalimonas asiatica TaxID=406100 RepID=A0A1H8Q2F1_9GAMM|nr:PEP/pyruvate-binding domain-containing protein [Aquisalimonas asiatica]SEO48087.1 pyruvate, water dikinase [Aquisalimonas asiatica]
MTLLIFPTDGAARDTIGGKAYGLQALQGAGTVPPWFVVPPSALHDCLTSAQQDALDSGDPTAIARALAALRMSDTLQQAVAGALKQVCPGDGTVAVRSSAIDEDGASHSFAGQLESSLYVTPEDVPREIVRVWQSAFGERVMAYRRERGLNGPPQAPAVLIQQMIDADAAGVAFSADVVSGSRSTAVIAATPGTGDALVSGDVNADTYHVDRAGTIIRRAPAAAGGTAAVALRDDQIQAIAALARRCAALDGRPQDVEWAIRNDRLHLLQSRPITTLAGLPDPDGEHAVWDNSNIAESYNGVTTPLTFSFARTVYEAVYREFCHLMRVPSQRVDANQAMFRRMLGLMNGRIYYNLCNWYRLLALLPGFTLNRRFMEQMMGVTERLDDGQTQPQRRENGLARVTDGLRLLRTTAGIAWNFIRLPASIRRFRERLDRALQPPEQPLEQMRPDELVGHYHALEGQLLKRWDAPLVNDFFAMIFHGSLRRLCERWCGDTDGSMANDLLIGEGNMISTEPAHRLRDLATLARGHTRLVEQLRHGSLAAINAAIADAPDFATAYEAYLDRFGDRCLEELKLESPTLRDDPLPLLRTVGELASRQQRPAGDYAGDAIRAATEQQARKALRGRPARRAVFWWVLRNARALVVDRENLRFERTRVFGRVRRIMVEMGRRLHADGVLNQPGDIFHLELDEVLRYPDGSATCTDLQALADARSAAFARFRALPAPPQRFETRGPAPLNVPTGNATADAGATDTDGDLVGQACCPGTVRGRVRVVHDPRDTVLEDGEILVAERTDPGWIMLLSAARGVVIEYGSQLSHAAIVSRELGTPAIVSVPGVTGTLQTGELVEINGGTGTIRRLSNPTREVA